MNRCLAGICFSFSFLCWTAFGLVDTSRSEKMAESVKHSTAPVSTTHVLEAYGQLPMSFEPNVGQADPQVKFLARGSGYTVFLTSNEAILALSRPVKTEPRKPQFSAGRSYSMGTEQTMVRIKLEGILKQPEITVQDELPGKVNYFIGNDPRKWRTNIPTYAKVKYKEIYPGIDVIFYANQGRLEYDFTVAPGADFEGIRLSFSGAGRIELDRQGDLLLHTPFGAIRQKRPFAYQHTKGKTREIASRYVLHGPKWVGFRFAAVDRAEPMVIDPVFVYSTFLGGSLSTGGTAIAADASGNAYVTGATSA